jgi:hypothetical protein
VLARLEDLRGVERAETDFAGDVLRLSLDDEGALPVAIDLLASLGYRAGVATGAVLVRAWYDGRSVGELSRVEAGVIADRVIAQLVEGHTLASGQAGPLRAALAGALHTCFVTNALGAGPSSGSFRDECVRVGVAAVVPVIGAVLADDLGRLLEADMRRIHRADPA